MEDGSCREFQKAVSQYLIRHKSILDVLSKIQESSARVNRAVAKAVTSCGCIEVKASRPQLPPEISFWEMKNYMNSHIEGSLCEECREVVESELGMNFFYLTALCTLLEMDLGQVLERERKRVSALGVFNLT